MENTFYEKIMKLFYKSIVGAKKTSIGKYFNDNCFLEDSNGSIKVRDYESEDLIFIVSYDSHGIVTDIQ
jgi:hypothetical protein